MTSDSVRPVEQRYNYGNALTGLTTLVREEGVNGLFRGMGTNLVGPIAFSSNGNLTPRADTRGPYEREF